MNEGATLCSLEVPVAEMSRRALSPKALFIFLGFGDSRCKGKSRPLYFETPVAEVPTRANRARRVPEMDDPDEYLNVGPLLARALSALRSTKASGIPDAKKKKPLFTF
jgi:hypothetical protein